MANSRKKLNTSPPWLTSPYFGEISDLPEKSSPSNMSLNPNEAESEYDIPSSRSLSSSLLISNSEEPLILSDEEPELANLQAGFEVLTFHSTLAPANSTLLAPSPLRTIYPVSPFERMTSQDMSSLSLSRSSSFSPYGYSHYPQNSLSSTPSSLNSPDPVSWFYSQPLSPATTPTPHLEEELNRYPRAPKIAPKNAKCAADKKRNLSPLFLDEVKEEPRSNKRYKIVEEPQAFFAAEDNAMLPKLSPQKQVTSSPFALWNYSPSKHNDATMEMEHLNNQASPKNRASRSLF